MIYDSVAGGRSINEDGSIDRIVYNNSAVTLGIGDYVAIDYYAVSDASSDKVARDTLCGYITTATTTNVKFTDTDGFMLENVASGSTGLMRVYGIHTSAYVATGSTTLADGVPVGFDSTGGRSGLVRAAYSSNQGVGSSAAMAAGYVISATSKIIYVV